MNLPKKLKMPLLSVVEFIRQFFFQNNVFKVQEVFSGLAIRVFLENGI
jgi:hypothetical protein